MAAVIKEPGARKKGRSRHEAARLSRLLGDDPVDPRVAEKMIPYLTEFFGNAAAAPRLRLEG